MYIASSIRFVAAETASVELRSLHPQCGCDTKDDVPPFTEFHGALPSGTSKAGLDKYEPPSTLGYAKYC